MSQEHYWKEFYRLKVHVTYVECMLEKTEQWDRTIKIFSAVTSSASIGAWAIWKELGFLWGGIIAVSQILNAIRPYLPYKDRLRCYSGLLHELEEILLGVESKWLDIASGECSEAAIRKALADLRARRFKAFKKHLPNSTVPEDGKVFEKAEEKANSYFQNFYSESTYDQSTETPAATTQPTGTPG